MLIAEENKELNIQLHLQSSEAEQKPVVIRRECNECNRLAWPLIVAKIIIEMLNHYTTPTEVVKILN